MHKKFAASRSITRLCGPLVLGVVAASHSSGAGAVNLSFLDGQLTAAFDSTLSYGVSQRVGGPTKRLDVANNGGNQNFDSGDLVTNRITGTHELELKYDTFGAFFRWTYFYDAVNDRKDLTIPTISDGRRADERAVSDFTQLDAYILARFDPVTVRLGKQVISWGESTFIQGSLNTINPFDVSKLRTPGSELKQALLPVPAAYVQWRLGPNLSAEAYYLTEFSNTKLDPAGTFWNTNAAIAKGGYRLGPLLRASDQNARNSGQWGVAFRYALGLGGLDFDTGLYFLNKHSDLPNLSVITGAPFGSPRRPTAQYFLDYPDDIKVWGLSFNTLVGPFAVGGEWSHRKDAPLQMNGFVQAAIGAPSQLTAGLTLPAGSVVRGYDRVTVDQFQVTTQLAKVPTYWNIIPGIPDAENSSWLFEIAYGHTSDMPKKQPFNPVTDSYGGFQTVFSLDYNRAIADVINLHPTIAFKYDLHGVSSEIAPNFIQNRRAVTLALNWDYLINLTGGVSYTANFGAKSKVNNGAAPLVGDRDRQWVSFNLAYQF